MRDTDHGPGGDEMTGDELLALVRLAWAEVLDVDTADSVPLDTSFLEAGGSSLLLVMLCEQLQAVTNRPVQVSDLFHHGTVRAQAALLAGGDEQGPDRTAIGARARERLIGRARRGAPVPASREAAPATGAE
ncbi:MAG TPA: acyl carrier protein [Micromonosporaceae bacterium]|nr:acyl carrier protein [Micromonosporaceae bacterium]